MNHTCDVPLARVPPINAATALVRPGLRRLFIAAALSTIAPALPWFQLRVHIAMATMATGQSRMVYGYETWTGWMCLGLGITGLALLLFDRAPSRQIPRVSRRWRLALAAAGLSVTVLSIALPAVDAAAYSAADSSSRLRILREVNHTLRDELPLLGVHHNEIGALYKEARLLLRHKIAIHVEVVPLASLATFVAWLAYGVGIWNAGPKRGTAGACAVAYPALQ